MAECPQCSRDSNECQCSTRILSGASNEVFYDDELKTTSRIKGYKQIKLLGRGASSAVYLAEQLTLAKRVAIKRLHPGLASDPRALSRFENEARALSNLKHPNLVSVFDLGTADDGSPYIVMEYADGTDLTKLIAEKAGIEPERAIQIASQLCDALACAHENQVIHRDLKPENIILIRDWEGTEQVKLVDFGIAKSEMQGDEIQRLTQTGELIGSPSYMSPEQIRGGEIDQRSDIYSLGCIMYEALTGRKPLRGESILSTLTLHLEKTPESLEKIKPHLEAHAELCALVLKCLEKDKDARVSSARDLKNALQKLSVAKVDRSQDPLRLTAIIIGVVLLTVNCVLFYSNNMRGSAPHSLSAETVKSRNAILAPPSVPTQNQMRTDDLVGELARSQILLYFDHKSTGVTNYENTLAGAIRTHAPVKTQLAISVFVAENYKTEPIAKWDRLYKQLEPALKTVLKSDSNDAACLFGAYFLWYYGYYQVWPAGAPPGPHSEVLVTTAIAHFDDAITLAKRRQNIDSKDLIGRLYLHTGQAYESVGNTYQAVQSYKQGCDFLDKSGGLASSDMMRTVLHLANASIALHAQPNQVTSKSNYLKDAQVAANNVIGAHPHPESKSEFDQLKDLNEAVKKLNALLAK